MFFCERQVVFFFFLHFELEHSETDWPHFAVGFPLPYLTAVKNMFRIAHSVSIFIIELLLALYRLLCLSTVMI